ncbi:hypothetical protein [Flavobacterium suzhouense]|uniref:PH (Pleckstrin Homology) domain-containing protein n=1 Tax=Flavobacterium suzhouense TaxID=1529638 RepID=A0ABW5NND6_9FLAO
MKTDKSLYNITIAAIKRHAMHPETWLYSKIISTPEAEGFDLDNEELPVFLIESEVAKTLVTTRRIIETSIGNSKQTLITEIQSTDYGLFKGDINKPDLSDFKIITINNNSITFQFETGKASIGLIYAINTLRKLHKH